MTLFVAEKVIDYAELHAILKTIEIGSLLNSNIPYQICNCYYKVT